MDKVKIISWLGTFIKTREEAINEYKSYMSYCDVNSSEYAKYASNLKALENGCQIIHE